MDLGIEPGEDFVERTDDAVGTCNVLLALIGRHWMTIRDESGQRRIDDPQDFVRLEIESALKRPDVLVVPVLVQGAEMPKQRELPVSMATLARRNALQLSDERWKYDVGRLIARLERAPGVRTEPATLPTLPVTPQPAPAPSRPGQHAPGRLALFAPLLGTVIAVPVAYVASYWVVDTVPDDEDWQKIVGLAAYRGLFWGVFSACVAAVTTAAGTDGRDRRPARIAAAAGRGLAIGVLAGAAAGALTQELRLRDHADSGFILGFALTGALVGAGRIASRLSAAGMVGGLLGGALGGLLVVASDTRSAFVNQAVAAVAIVLCIVLAASRWRSRPAAGDRRQRHGTVAAG
jgi:hypothetical protein